AVADAGERRTAGSRRAPGRPPYHPSGSGRGPRRRRAAAARAGTGLVLVREPVHGVLGLARARLDPVAVLALGPLVDGLRGLVQAALDLVPVLLGEVGDLPLRRAQFGLQIVQETHGSPSVTAGPMCGRPHRRRCRPPRRTAASGSRRRRRRRRSRPPPRRTAPAPRRTPPSPVRLPPRPSAVRPPASRPPGSRPPGSRPPGSRRAGLPPSPRSWPRICEAAVRKRPCQLHTVLVREASRVVARRRALLRERP